tara:strand:- start:2002 stop:2739 length:738 start_codon:yes stop_codon:yes gene_type:complete
MHVFQKKWGQNFLYDLNTAKKIISFLELSSNENVLEIGPGDGALTKILVQKAKKVYAVEIDSRLVQILNDLNFSNLNIINNDILKDDLYRYPETIKIVGNLPYYIASTIIIKLLKYNKWTSMLFMVQKEVGERIVADFGNKDYGRLSVMCQVFSSPIKKMDVSKRVFFPTPKIDSSIILFKPRLSIPVDQFDEFSEFIKLAFRHRRKKIKNNLTCFYKDGLLNELSDLRPEQITPRQYINLFGSK